MLALLYLEPSANICSSYRLYMYTVLCFLYTATHVAHAKPNVIHVRFVLVCVLKIQCKVHSSYDRTTVLLRLRYGNVYLVPTVHVHMYV